MKNKFLAGALVALLWFTAVEQVGAQWLTQTVVVSNGWTAAYLFVDASSQGLIPTTPGVPIAAGNPIDKIWLWKAPPSTAQYLTTPASPLTAGGPWVSWGLTNSQNSLTALIPNAAYLIHSSSPTPYYWKIQGQPVPPRYSWDLTGLNFIGFATPTNNPPNFQNFFAPATSIAGLAQIYQYVGGELATSPANPALVISQYYTPVTRGQAYWVSATNVNNNYFSPFQITLPNSVGLTYGATGGQLTFYLVNVTPNTLTVTMTVAPSETAPAGQTNIVGVPPLLLEGAQNPANLTYAYTSLSPGGGGGSSNTVSWTLSPAGQSGSEVAVTLGVNRYAMTSAAPGSLYAGILEFSDSLGFSEINIPVSAISANNAGLWVGKVNVTNVSYDLKTYVTNGDGSIAMNEVTNAVVMTNTYTVGTTTNLSVNNGVITNVNITNFDTTNVVVNTYEIPGLQNLTNGYVISTNFTVDYTIITNSVIETEVIGYYFTNANPPIVWITTNIDLPPVVTIQSNTSFAVVTNSIPPVPGNGTVVPITNITTAYSSVSSFLVTNGPYENPVTNLVSSNYYTTVVPAPSTAAAYNVTSNVLVTNILTVSNAPVAQVYSTTNLQVLNFSATNFYPQSRPVYQATNGNTLTWFNAQTNIFSITNVVNTFHTTNFQVISNTYVVTQGVTNFVSATTNVVLFQQSGSGAETTNFYTNISLLTFTNPLQYLVTNYLSSPASNYVIASHNTSGDSVPAPYPLRLIVFNDNSGNCSLLQRVYWGLNPATNLVVSTTQASLDQTQLSTARRITATHLPWSATNTPWALSGGPLAQGAVLTSVPIIENYDDQAANPFLHTYHPDHNNLTTASPPHELPMGSESYQISRVISLSLMPNTNDFLSLTSANSSLSGQYNETLSLTGLGGFAKTYQTIGAFSLTQISTVSYLSTQ